MELKFLNQLQANYRCTCFNRTFMELKLIEIRNLKTETLSFNRTFMELKLRMLQAKA